VVPENDRGIFEEISRVILGKPAEAVSTNFDLIHEQDNLEYFQKLMTSLISEAHASWVFLDDSGEVGGRRLSTIHEKFEVHVDAPEESDSRYTVPEVQQSFPENEEDCHKGEILKEWKPASEWVILLAATTIFMVIITFLLGEQRILASLYNLNIKKCNFTAFRNSDDLSSIHGNPEASAISPTLLLHPSSVLGCFLSNNTSPDGILCANHPPKFSLSASLDQSS